MTENAYEAGKSFGEKIAELCIAGDFQKLNAMEPEGDEIRKKFEDDEGALQEFEKGFMEIAGPELEKMMQGMVGKMGEMMEGIGEAMGGMAQGMAEAFGEETEDGKPSKDISEEIKGSIREASGKLAGEMKKSIGSADGKSENEDD